MEQKNEHPPFQYSYSAKEQSEIKRIREKYADPKSRPETKMERLRRLDQSVTQKAQAVSLIFGVGGALILGFGMSLCMTDLAVLLGSLQSLSMLFGILIGILGGILASLAYPMYQLVTKRERKKLAPEILRLTEELMQ